MSLTKNPLFYIENNRILLSSAKRMLSAVLMASKS
jgi:hypothetical protein